MCSIFGCFSRYKNKDSIIQYTLKALEVTHYRGPDHSNYVFFDSLNLAVGHNRLAIIDLSETANQPMFSEDKNLCVVFNGEIYNYLEIKNQLEQKGYKFLTNSDTEVIIHSYKDYGLNFVKQFDGMFSICLFDVTEKKLIIARDIAGEKPLYYYFDGHDFIFASELKQILIQDIKTLFNYERLNFYFAFGYLPDTLTFFSNIHKLPPAHMLIFDLNSNSIEVLKYWEFPNFESSIPEDEVLERICAILKKSVSRRLISDVPLGAFLSGGIDSSLTVAFIRELGLNIKTFTIGFEGSMKNENKYARIVANYLETDHTEIIVKPEFEQTLEEIALSLDEPIYDSSILPTYYLCKHVRNSVKVALSGDGGDELFAGYVHYLSSALCNKISRYVPCFFRKFLSFLGMTMPEGTFGKNTLMSLGRGGYECYIYQTQIFKNHERKRLLPYLQNYDEPNLFKQQLMDKYSGDFINKMAVADFFTNLQQILVKVDRASMMNSLEVRTPFLNKELIELSFRNIDGQMKIKDNKTKYLLKRIAKFKLPSNFPVDRKQGFDIPKDFITKTNLIKKIRDIENLDFLNENYISQIITSQARNRGNFWNKLFAIYMFKVWYSKWVN